MTFTIHSKKYGKHIVEIDDEDAEKILCFTWHVHYCRRGKTFVLKGARTDVIRNGKKKKLLLHRLLIQHPSVDHIDGNVLNNKKNNLRKCSNSENACNCKKHSNNTSGFKGVSWHKRIKKFHAHIGYKRQKISVGYFKTAKEAARAYNKAAIKYHGEFARLNVL